MCSLPSTEHKKIHSLPEGGTGYSKQLSFWLGAFTIKATAIDSTSASALLSLTTLTDLVVLAFFETSQIVSQIASAATEDIVSMSRVLVK